MSVHEAISEHSRKQKEHLSVFMKLDQERERHIESALDACRRGLPFNVAPINAVTSAINELATRGISPTRRYVSVAMIREFAASQQ